VRRALLSTFRRLIRLYFRRVERAGEPPGPETRGRVFVSNLALYAIPYFVPRFIARSHDPDAVSTVKLGAALVVYPVWMAGLVGMSFIVLPPPLSLGAAAVVIASPFAALTWLDEYWERQADATPDELAHLARLRIAARTAIDEARSRLTG
jgi:hypothetical protein